ncbi:hypothetical protein PVW46_06190 [Mameliella sp. AT18]|nr:hypothetical protein [Mameliella sp. AT18]MDD9729493.1 hypothetical protein [Mameliella sp. AT18]
MRAFLARLMAPAPRCGALCQQVQEELSAMRLSDSLHALSDRQRYR